MSDKWTNIYIRWELLPNENSYLILLLNMNTIIIIDARTTKTKSKISTTIPAMYPEVGAPAIGDSADSGDVDTVSLKPKE